MLPKESRVRQGRPGLSPTPESNPKVTKYNSGSHHKAESSAKASESRKCPTLKGKIEVIQLSSKGEIFTRKLASRLGCSKKGYEFQVKFLANDYFHELVKGSICDKVDTQVGLKI